MCAGRRPRKDIGARPGTSDPLLRRRSRGSLRYTRPGPFLPPIRCPGRANNRAVAENNGVVPVNDDFLSRMSERALRLPLFHGLWLNYRFREDKTEPGGCAPDGGPEKGWRPSGRNTVLYQVISTTDFSFAHCGIIRWKFRFDNLLNGIPIFRVKTLKIKL
jgi:hypothetical protein